MTPIKPDFSLAKGILAHENVSRKRGVTVCYVFYTPEESDGGTVGVKEVHALGHLLHKKSEKRGSPGISGIGPCSFSPGYLDLLVVDDRTVLTWIKIHCFLYPSSNCSRIEDSPAFEKKQ